MAKKKSLGFVIPEDKTLDLPTTEKAFDMLVDEVCDRYNIVNKEHAAAVIANRIMHLPVDQATTTLRYMGSCVRKNISYQIAQAKGSRIAHVHQIDDIVQVLKTDPNNAEARDALVKAAADGSAYANEQIAKLDAPLAPPSEDTQAQVSSDESTKH